MSALLITLLLRYLFEGTSVLVSCQVNVSFEIGLNAAQNLLDLLLLLLLLIVYDGLKLLRYAHHLHGRFRSTYGVLLLSHPRVNALASLLVSLFIREQLLCGVEDCGPGGLPLPLWVPVT